MKKHIYYILPLLIVMQPLMANAAAVKPFLDLLAWRASESNTSWATTLTFPDNATHVIQSDMNFNTRLGVKAGISYEPDNNFWDTKFYWTYLPTSGSKTIPVSSNIVTSLFFSGSYFISNDKVVIVHNQKIIHPCSNWQGQTPWKEVNVYSYPRVDK